MAELLLELFSEEIPARMQDRAREELGRGLRELLGKRLLLHEDDRAEFSTYATPRRLVVVAKQLRQAKPFVQTLRMGPPATAPQTAIDGFLRSLGNADFSIQEQEAKGRRFLVANIKEPERGAAEILAEELPGLLSAFSWPKSMHWGASDFRWVRPLQSIMCLFDGNVVPFDVAGIASGNVTRGHRFMAPASFAVRDFADYVVKLRNAKVILDGTERRALIAHASEELAASEGYTLAVDPALLDEITGLVEWPTPLMGSIDDGFMALPAEALVGTMRANQKYLTMRTAEGALAPRFVVVANIAASDGGAAIVAGNERVLRARLWDARFFWDQDRKTSLESRLPALERMVFHAELGSQGQRVERLVALAGAIVPHVPGSDRMLAERAALLAKADLVTGMVGEFPELQGIMGGHYARVQGEPAAVAAAIRDHYAPKGPDDTCPSAPDSVVVALTDKLDTLAGFFSHNIRPTGSKDPFALRRAALGVTRLILENKLRIPLRRVLHDAIAKYGGLVGFYPTMHGLDELLNFFADRLKVHMKDQGVRHDVVAAAFAVGAEDDLVRLIARAEALQAFLDSEDGRNLLTAYRRASSIVGIEEKKDDRRYDGHPVVGALVDPAEEDLHEALERAQGVIDLALKTEDYAEAMAALAALRQPVDRFFEAVMVNVTEPDLRVNRLLLLSQIRSSLGRVADFSLVEDVPSAAG